MQNIFTSVPENKRCSPTGLIPDGFDPATMSILAVHWFGIEPWRQVGTVAAEIIDDLNFRHQVKLLHPRGPRILRGFLEVRR